MYVSKDAAFPFMLSVMSFTSDDVSSSECMTRDLNLLSCVEDFDTFA